MKIFGINLEKLIIEAVDEVNPLSIEKQRQTMKADELKPFKVGEKKKSSEEDVDEAEDEDSDNSKGVAKVSKDKPEEVGASVEEVPEISAAKIVKILNQMRSGKSLSDKQVRIDFQKYYNSLDGDERLAFYTFLDAVQKIVAEDEEFEMGDVTTPDLQGVDVDVDVEKRKKKKKAKKAEPQDKGTDSSPIVVGEHADKSRIKLLLRRNR